MKLSANYNEQHDAERVGRPMDSYIAAALINRVFLHDQACVPRLFLDFRSTCVRQERRETVCGGNET